MYEPLENYLYIDNLFLYLMETRTKKIDTNQPLQHQISQSHVPVIYTLRNENVLFCRQMVQIEWKSCYFMRLKIKIQSMMCCLLFIEVSTSDGDLIVMCGNRCVNSLIVCCKVIATLPQMHDEEKLPFTRNFLPASFFPSNTPVLHLQISIRRNSA